jgi:large subunit ribosomal protein L30e
MALVEEIQSALKEDRVLIGYKKSLEFIKSDSPEFVVIAQNMPEKERKEIEHNAKLSGTKIETFEGSSKELGVICGRPFPIMLLVIKK